MRQFSVIFSAALAVALMTSAGCSKKQPETPPPVSMIEVTQTMPKAEAPTPPPVESPAKPAPPVSAVSAPPAVVQPTVVPPVPPTNEEETPAQLTARVKQLENKYESAPDFQKRVTILFDLSSTDSPEAVDAIGRLFVKETDQELRIELISSLSDIDGQNDKKLAILSMGLRADQPKDVRLQAIDGMSDLEDQRGIQLLQAYANDPDQDVKESVQDTIEQLQNPPPPLKPMGQ